MLCAQRSNWRTFWQFQQRLRHHYRNKSFSIFLSEIRERRRTHKLNVNVHLLLNAQQQSRQQNWIEFQDYHFNLHERQKKKRNELQQELINFQKEVDDTNRKDSDYLVQQKRVIYQRLKYVQRILQWHEIMLCWIEKCRLMMNSLFRTFAEKDSGRNILFHRQRHSKKRDTLTVFEKIKISKFPTKNQNIQTRTFKATVFNSAFIDSFVTISNSIEEQMSKRRKMKPRRVKKKTFVQIFLRRWSKQIDSLLLKSNRDQKHCATTTIEFEIEQDLNADRSFSSHFLRLEALKFKLNEYQKSQWDESQSKNDIIRFSTSWYPQLKIEWTINAMWRIERGDSQFCNDNATEKMIVIAKLESVVRSCNWHRIRRWLAIDFEKVWRLFNLFWIFVFSCHFYLNQS